LNACVTLSFVFTCRLIKMVVCGLRPQMSRDRHISARAAFPLSTAAT
jgi:hypothetical protein